MPRLSFITSLTPLKAALLLMGHGRSEEKENLLLPPLPPSANSPVNSWRVGLEAAAALSLAQQLLSLSLSR